MTGRTHLHVGWTVGAGLAVADFHTFGLLAAGTLLTAAAGSLAPDLDTEQSKGNWKLYKATAKIPILGWLVRKHPWTHLTHHRGICHLNLSNRRASQLLKLVVLMLASALLISGVLWALLLAGFLFGVLSHLVLDVPHKPGVALEFFTRGLAFLLLITVILQVSGHLMPLLIEVSRVRTGI